jgi:transposase
MGDVKEIALQMKEAEKTSYYRKLQCVHLALLHPEMSAAQIGKITLYSTSRVWAIHAEYRENGLEGLVDGRGGRYRENMTVDDETELLETFKEESENGKLVVAGKIKLAYEAKVGKEVAESTIYRMLDRHGFRKIVPYKRHPKANKEEQETFKKTFPI